MAYDTRITDLARIAAIAAGRNAGVVPQLLMADFTFAIADAVEDGRIILGRLKEEATSDPQVEG